LGVYGRLRVLLLVGLLHCSVDVLMTGALLCLALNIYHEARGEPIEGQIAVAQVTLNRVASPDYPDDVCSVVYEPHQFSWTTKKPHPPAKRNEAYIQARDVARGVLNGELGGILHYGTLWYHAKGVSPHWASEKVFDKKIGGHVFYKAY